MASTAKSRPGETVRLDATAWKVAALEMLAAKGIDGVSVEPLAKRLGVTKGSFYWHFKDRDALHDAMLVHWRKKATLALIERLDRTETSAEVRFRRLLRLPMAGQRAENAADVELAIRMWGRRDPRAQATLEEVDQLRLRYIARLLVECGTPPGEENARAILGYAYMRVAATLIPTEARDLMDQCETLLIGASSP